MSCNLQNETDRNQIKNQGHFQILLTGRCGFSSLINFHSLNHHWSVLLDHIALQLDREEIKERELDGERGRGGGLFEGGNYSKYFHQKGGDYSKEVINWGMAIIQGNTVWSFPLI